MGDARLNARLFAIATALAEHPEQSLPQACEDWAATKAAYRFFDNPSVDPEEILAAHRQATLRRIAGRDLILLAQDTTQFDFTTHRGTRGMGPTGAPGLQGFFLHSALAITVEGIPLGLLGSHAWKRRDEEHAPLPQQRRSIEDKESGRWLEMLTASTAGVGPETTVVTVADREADIIDFLLLAIAQNQPVLVRASHDRALAGGDSRLWEAVETTPALGMLHIRVPRQAERPARDATVALRATTVELAPPGYRRREALPTAQVTAILASEINPPADQEPVHWLLLATFPVTTAEQAGQCVRWYTYRWRIERFHFTLKSGCRIERLELEEAIRIRRALALYCVVAWRLLFLTYAAREHPQMPCTVFLSQDEWQALYCRRHKTRKPPSEPPDVHTAVRWIAMLGGFLGRKGDGEPGVKVLWRGFRRLQDITEDWRIFRE